MRSILRAALVALSAVPLALALASCDSSSSDTSQTTTGTGGSGGSEPVYKTSGCGICVEEEACVAQFNTCASDPSCAEYLNCLNECPLAPSGDADPECEKACPAVTGTAGEAARSAFIECRTSGAGVECTDCGQLPVCNNPLFQQTCPASVETNKCYICQDEHCCDSYQTCLGNQSCLDLQDCAKACPNDTFAECLGQCFKDYPDGFLDFNSKLTCIVQFCAGDDACGNEPLDPCVKCTNTHCACEHADCQQDYQCAQLDNCQVPCDPTDQPCFDACEDQFPEGKAKHDTYLACAYDNCDIACGGTTP